MAAKGFSFAFKNSISDPRREIESSSDAGSTASPSSNVHILFEAPQRKEADDVKARSTVTALGAFGFKETIEYDARPVIPIIPCKNKLRKPGKRDNVVWLPNESRAETKESRAGDQKCVSEKVNFSRSEDDGIVSSISKSDRGELFGLTAGDIDESDDIGPPIEEIMKWRRRREGKSVTADKGDVPILATNSKLFGLRKQHGDDEKGLFKKEMETLPEFSNDSYENIPVESFGMAMLLGMGYDATKHTTKPAELKKRIYQRAGLGADKEFELPMEMTKLLQVNQKK